eukprot:1147322-Pelagomonas_calceolata.AAC.7
MRRQSCVQMLATYEAMLLLACTHSHASSVMCTNAAREPLSNHPHEFRKPPMDTAMLCQLYAHMLHTGTAMLRQSHAHMQPTTQPCFTLPARAAMLRQLCAHMLHTGTAMLRQSHAHMQPTRTAMLHPAPCGRYEQPSNIQATPEQHLCEHPSNIRATALLALCSAAAVACLASASAAVGWDCMCDPWCVALASQPSNCVPVMQR